MLKAFLPIRPLMEKKLRFSGSTISAACVGVEGVTTSAATGFSVFILSVSATSWYSQFGHLPFVSSNSVLQFGHFINVKTSKYH
jgi:hypothetical protein